MEDVQLSIIPSKKEYHPLTDAINSIRFITHTHTYIYTYKTYVEAKVNEKSELC